MSKKNKRAQRNNAQRVTLYTALAVLAVAALGGVYWLQVQSSQPAPSADGVDFRLEQQPSLGSDGAPVKVVEFGDYKCPACKQFHQDVYPRIVLDYVDQNLVEFFFINFQFIGPDSTTAGIAGECVYEQNEAAFWDYFDTVFEHQGPESQRWATPERLLELIRADVPDVDPAAVGTCIQGRRHQDEVARDKQIGEAAGVTGTPTIFVDGTKVANFSYGAVRAAIERALDEAQ